MRIVGLQVQHAKTSIRVVGEPLPVSAARKRRQLSAPTAWPCEGADHRVARICCWCYIGAVLIDWSTDFDRWLTELERRVAAGYDRAQDRLDIVTAQLEYLQDLKEPPTDDTPTLKRVSQSGRYQVWRLSHPFRDGIAIRPDCLVPTRCSAGDRIVWQRQGTDG